jgi:ABC-type branched-subunit amino acid transport system substrate-binding protein
VAAIGDVCSSSTLAAKEFLDSIPVISPSATSDKLTNATDNFMRVSVCIQQSCYIVM